VSADGGEVWRDHAAKSGVAVKRWSELLDVAERTHREFLDAIKQRAPEDARIQGLPPVQTTTPVEPAAAPTAAAAAKPEKK
jgi:hypothetical protein